MKALILITILFLIGCGKHGGESDNGDRNSEIPASDITINDAKGNIVGYFLGFSPRIDVPRYYKPASSSNAFILIKKTSEIVEIDLMTGLYVSDRITCSTIDCGATHYSMGNVLTGQVVYVENYGYFKASGKGLVISIAGCLDKLGPYITDGCANETHGTLLSGVARPYDFTALAPVILSAPEDKDSNGNGHKE